jgi:hypothetical protein
MGLLIGIGERVGGTRFPQAAAGLTTGTLAWLLSITLTLELFLLHYSDCCDIIHNTSLTMSDSDSEGGIPLIEAEFDNTASSKKRKREAEPEATKESKKAAKKLKRREKKKQKAKEIDEDDLDQELGVNHSFERMDGQLVADYVNARTRLYGKELSSVELEDKFIPGMFDVLLRTMDLTMASENCARQYKLERATNYGQAIRISEEAVYFGTTNTQKTRGSAAHHHRYGIGNSCSRLMQVTQGWST